MFAITHKIFYCALAMLVFSMAATPAARAATPQQIELLTHLMIENQGDNAGFLGLMFGPDPGSPLNFSSNVDPSGTTFSFSTNPGTTYQGQSLSLSGSGTFNPSMDVLTLSSSGTLGSDSWTTSGTETITGSGDIISSTANFDLFNAAQQKAGDKERVATLYDRTNGTSVDIGVYTDKDGKPIPGGLFTSTDKYNKATGEWEFKETPAGGLNFAVASQGFSPLTGGTGTFVASVVPEPSASLLFLGGLSVLWLAFARRRFSGNGGGNGMQVSVA